MAITKMPNKIKQKYEIYSLLFIANPDTCGKSCNNSSTVLKPKIGITTSKANTVPVFTKRYTVGVRFMVSLDKTKQYN